jgi:glycosyltransferase involved in cell wall biosynthesis
VTSIAVVVPTHNRPELLAVTLRSIVAQRGVDLTVTIVDDGSSDADAVAAVIKSLADERLRLIRNDTPGGVSAARNLGIRATSSEWLAFCDDDDVWAPEKLREQLIAATAQSAPWAYAGDVAIDEDLQVLNGEVPLPPSQLVDALQRWNPVPAGSSNVFIRRDVLEAVGIFDPNLRSVGDWDLWVRLGRYGLPACVPRPLVGCRVHRHTITRNRRMMLNEVQLVAARHDLPVDLARHFRWAAWNALLEGQRSEALAYYLRAVRLGDVASIGRCAVTIFNPRLPQRRVQHPPGEWARAAQPWLDRLRGEAGARR